MFLNEVIWHNENAYKIIKKIKHHQVSPKGILNDAGQLDGQTILDNLKES